MNLRRVTHTTPITRYSPVHTCGQFDKTRLTNWFDRDFSAINLLWYQNQARFGGANLHRWVDNQIVRSGMDTEFRVDDIVSPNEPVKAFHMADLTHRINEKILIPNGLILVASPAGNDLCPILSNSSTVTRGGIEIPVYEFEHSNQLGATIMIAFMNYIAVSSSAEETAKFHYDISKSSSVPQSADLQLSQVVYRHAFNGLQKDDAVSAYLEAHMEEEMAHSDAFRYVACGLGRRANRMRDEHEEKLGTEILQKERRDSSEPVIHLHASYADLKTKKGMRKVANSNFELEAKINAIRHSQHPEIVFLGIIQQQRDSNYNMCTDFALGMFGKKLLGAPSTEYRKWENYLKTNLTQGSSCSADIKSAASFWYPVQFLDYGDRDTQRPRWRQFVLS